MNAKETIKKIADALNISDASQEAAPVADETKETAPVEETKVEATEEKVEETKVEEPKAEETVETPEVKEEVKEEVKAEEPKAEEPKTDPKVAELENQLAEMQKLLDAAIKQDKAVEEAPEAPVQPLTHSPETKAANEPKRMGGHGGTIMDRVFKYID